MKRKPKGSSQRSPTLQVWTFAQAQAAAPYIASVVSSLREHALQTLFHARKAQRLEALSNRPRRDTLIARQEAENAARNAEASFQDAVAELEPLDIYPLDPIRGQALVPFVQEGQLAWYIFDLFDPKPFRFWRYHTDPADTRRLVTAQQQGQAEESTQLA
jgi:hypothetical protein